MKKITSKSNRNVLILFGALLKKVTEEWNTLNIRRKELEKVLNKMVLEGYAEQLSNAHSAEEVNNIKKGLQGFTRSLSRF